MKILWIYFLFFMALISTVASVYAGDSNRCSKASGINFPSPDFEALQQQGGNTILYKEVAKSSYVENTTCNLGATANEFRLSKNNIHREVTALDKAIDKALYESDIDTLFSVLTEDFLWVHAGAYAIQTKTETLDYLAELPENTFLSEIQRSGTKIQTYENSVIISGFLLAQLVPEKYTKFHIQRVYVKLECSWKLASQHATLVYNRS